MIEWKYFYVQSHKNKNMEFKDIIFIIVALVFAVILVYFLIWLLPVILVLVIAFVIYIFLKGNYGKSNWD